MLSLRSLLAAAPLLALAVAQLRRCHVGSATQVRTRFQDLIAHRRLNPTVRPWSPRITNPSPSSIQFRRLRGIPMAITASEQTAAAKV